MVNCESGRAGDSSYWFDGDDVSTSCELPTGGSVGLGGGSDCGPSG